MPYKETFSINWVLWKDLHQFIFNMFLVFLMSLDSCQINEWSTDIILSEFLKQHIVTITYSCRLIFLYLLFLSQCFQLMYFLAFLKYQLYLVTFQELFKLCVYAILIPILVTFSVSPREFSRLANSFCDANQHLC